MIKRTVLSVALVVFIFFTAKSQNIGGGDYNYMGQLNAITTSVPFLLIAPDSRSAGMGDIGCATSADAASQHHNPSKYVFNENIFGVSISYSPWLRKLVNDINLLYLSAYWKITDMDAIAFSLRYFSLGDIMFTDENGQPMGSQRPNEFALDFTYSRKLIDQLSIAITPRFIYSDLTAGQQVGEDETFVGLAGAADLSLFYEQDFYAKGLFNSTLRAGLNISNMGSKMTYSSGQKKDFLPANLKLGLTYTMQFNEYNRLSVMGEVSKLLVPTPPVYATDSSGRMIYDDAMNPVILAGRSNDVSTVVGMIQSFYDAPGGFKEEMSEFVWALGLEYDYRDLLFVRFGYFNESENKGNRKYLTFGAGLKYNILALDVAYLFTVDQNHPLENTLRFTLTFDFASFNKDVIKKQNRLN